MPAAVPGQPPPLLPRSFYDHQDVIGISRALLGKFLVTRIDGHHTAGKIVETEAYRAPEDKASHAYNNRLTKRTRVMFGPPGTAYIYLCYGIHHLFNVVTGREGIAHAVLIRALEPTDNIDLMMERRAFTRFRPQLTAGPGVMSKALGITTAYNAIDLTCPDSPIRIEDRAVVVPEEEIIAGPRIGVDYAEECARWEWRFFIKGNPWVSRGGK